MAPLFVQVVDEDHVRLCATADLPASAVKGLGVKARMQQILDGAERFKTRIPELQVSMAKVQSFMMKQKLLAEVDLKGQMPMELAAAAATMDPNSKHFKALYAREVNQRAAETAVMHIHELINVEADDRQTKVHIYDHLRRVGLHQYAPFFEHFGIHEKAHLSADTLSKMVEWHPDFKVGGPQLDRLKKLMDADSKVLDAAYMLADISSLRDRFLEAYPDAADPRDPGSQGPSMDYDAVMATFRRLDKDGNGQLSLSEFEAWFDEAASGAAKLGTDVVKANFRIFDRDGSNFISQSEFLETCREHIEVLPACQQSAGALASPTPRTTGKLHLTYVQLIKEKSFSKEEDGTRALMWRVEQAHKFQQVLEKDGKSEVSMWQLDMHFARYEADPVAAVGNAHRLLHNHSQRSRTEREVKWMTAAEFLLRLGLEKYAAAMEAMGYKHWHDFKHFDKQTWVQQVLSKDQEP